MAHDVEGHQAGTEVPGGPAQEGGSFPPFDPNNFAAELIWLAITFGAIYLLMSKIALPRVAKILAARKDKIDSDLATAAKAQEDAAAAAAAHEKTLADAKVKAQDLGNAAHAEFNAPGRRPPRDARSRTQRQDRVSRSADRRDQDRRHGQCRFASRPRRPRPSCNTSPASRPIPPPSRPRSPR